VIRHHHEPIPRNWGTIHRVCRSGLDDSSNSEPKCVLK
jgi:hypothetical protein